MVAPYALWRTAVQDERPTLHVMCLAREKRPLKTPINVVSALPKSSTGKLLRRALRSG